jgi:hypothetical protein
MVVSSFHVRFCPPHLTSYATSFIETYLAMPWPELCDLPSIENLPASLNKQGKTSDDRKETDKAMQPAPQRLMVLRRGNGQCSAEFKLSGCYAKFLYAPER